MKDEDVRIGTLIKCVATHYSPVSALGFLQEGKANENRVTPRWLYG